MVKNSFGYERGMAKGQNALSPSPRTVMETADIDDRFSEEPNK